MNRDYLVTKSNTLITSSYDLSLEEQRIILTLASMVQPNDEDFKSYKFKIKDFMDLLGVEAKSKYTVLPKITKELMQKVFEIKQDDKIIQVAWLSSAEYQKGTGGIQLEFSPKLKPFMLGLKQFYTSYRLKNVLELKGKYSIRMYEILKSNEFKKVVIIEVDELRDILKANTGSYLIYQNFKNRIINKAQKELKEKTDISFDYEEIKTGRKVTSIKFYIKSNTKNKANEESAATSKKDPEELIMDNSIKRVMTIMSQHEIEALEAKKIYDAAMGDFKAIEKCYAYCCQKKVNNIVGYMIKLVTPGEFQEPKKNIPSSGWNNYHQRTYDFDDLENKLLEWEKNYE